MRKRNNETKYTYKYMCIHLSYGNIFFPPANNYFYFMTEKFVFLNLVGSSGPGRDVELQPARPGLVVG